jgi:uncharacterized RDD family membrane protein YckC
MDAAPVPRAAKVAARVAERYARVPSYSEMLAAEAARTAEAAAQAALAAHEAAQQAARAATEVLWADLEMEEPAAETQTRPDPREDSRSGANPRPASARDSHAASKSAPYAETPLFPEPVQYRVDPASLPAARSGLQTPQAEPRMGVEPYPHVFDPLEEAMVAPAQPLPARVLEFPRELVAARKARPRLAEGPLRDGMEPDKAQLRIFEVEPEAISHQPAASAPMTMEEAVLPEWSSIRLDAAPRHAEPELSAAGAASMHTGNTGRGVAQKHAAPLSSRAGRSAAGTRTRGRSRFEDVLPLHVAPIEDRLMAAIVDAALVLGAFLLFVLVFVACTPHPPVGKPAIVTAGAVLVGFIALYEWLFFTYAESTPGMRYARIALCTFDDENPGRRTLQHRVGACFLAALPMGLGFLWALLDDDRLGWHDRMTGTYQRSYKQPENPIKS